MPFLNFSMTAWAIDPSQIEHVLKHETKPELQHSHVDMSTCGWVRLGTASVTVEMPDESEIKLAAVQQCNEAIKKVRADTEVKVAHLEQMIQNLLAIEYTAPAQVKPVPDFTDVDDAIPF